MASLEALKVVEGSTGLAANDGLTPWACLPLGNNVILGKGSLDDLGAHTTSEVEAELGEGNPLDIDHLSGNIGGGSIDDDLCILFNTCVFVVSCSFLYICLLFCVL